MINHCRVDYLALHLLDVHCVEINYSTITVTIHTVNQGKISVNFALEYSYADITTTFQTTWHWQTINLPNWRFVSFQEVALNGNAFLSRPNSPHMMGVFVSLKSRLHSNNTSSVVTRQWYVVISELSEWISQRWWLSMATHGISAWQREYRITRGQ